MLRVLDLNTQHWWRTRVPVGIEASPNACGWQWTKVRVSGDFRGMVRHHVILTCGKNQTNKVPHNYSHGSSHFCSRLSGVRFLGHAARLGWENGSNPLNFK